eukprot:TRINITY_DN74094_c0_g1_i1.p1 TRINITY_DN74094_c0_g1~~TRINITY_DN74094_c0_g1_i1.p1  ORF type:complete len:365 (+),score=51.04 TRINITY_DN74094_c0_g1_i1:94-1188(+)
MAHAVCDRPLMRCAGRQQLVSPRLAASSSSCEGGRARSTSRERSRGSVFGSCIWEPTQRRSSRPLCTPSVAPSTVQASSRRSPSPGARNLLRPSPGSCIWEPAPRPLRRTSQSIARSSSQRSASPAGRSFPRLSSTLRQTAPQQAEARVGNLCKTLSEMDLTETCERRLARLREEAKAQQCKRESMEKRIRCVQRQSSLLLLQQTSASDTASVEKKQQQQRRSAAGVEEAQSDVESPMVGISQASSRVILSRDSSVCGGGGISLVATWLTRTPGFGEDAGLCDTGLSRQHSASMRSFKICHDASTEEGDDGSDAMGSDVITLQESSSVRSLKLSHSHSDQGNSDPPSLFTLVKNSSDASTVTPE